MEKKTKTILWITAGVVSAVGIYFAATKFFKKKIDESASDEALPLAETPPSSGKSASKVGTSITKIVKDLKIPATTQTTVNGKKTWVYANMANTKTYNKKGNGVGTLYNTYQTGNIIGTYIGQVSIGGLKYYFVNDKGKSIVVSSNAVYLKNL